MRRPGGSPRRAQATALLVGRTRALDASRPPRDLAARGRPRPGASRGAHVPRAPRAVRGFLAGVLSPIPPRRRGGGVAMAGCSKCRYAARGCRRCVENFVPASTVRAAKAAEKYGPPAQPLKPVDANAPAKRPRGRPPGSKNKRDSGTHPKTPALKAATAAKAAACARSSPRPPPPSPRNARARRLKTTRTRAPVDPPQPPHTPRPRPPRPPRPRPPRPRLRDWTFRGNSPPRPGRRAPPRLSTSAAPPPPRRRRR